MPSPARAQVSASASAAARYLSSLSLSAALLLDWMGQRHQNKAFVKAGVAIEEAVRQAVKAGESTADVGGRLGTQATGKTLATRLRALS